MRTIRRKTRGGAIPEGPESPRPGNGQAGGLPRQPIDSLTVHGRQGHELAQRTARHGGGAFSGKDPSKVDRSACYAARYVAKHLVAEGLARRAEVALAYAIGVAKPVSVQVNTFGTGVRTDEQLSHEVMERFDLSPDGIIRMLDLRRPIYRQTAAYGHFGRPDLDLPWEALD